jgi:hypothetical protein
MRMVTQHCSKPNALRHWGLPLAVLAFSVCLAPFDRFEVLAMASKDF